VGVGVKLGKFVGRDGMGGGVPRRDDVPVGAGEALPVEAGDGEDGVEEGNGFVKGTETC
jgi:hypothetical protein